MNSKLKSSIFLMLSVVLFSSCSGKKEKLTQEINTLESQLTGNLGDVVDSVAVNKMINLYIEYADLFPDDTTSANYLFKAGDIASKTNKIDQSISIFEKLVTKYPDNRNAPYGLFLQGFIYENQVGDAMKAKPYYEKFLQLYPDHPIAGDVTFSLENLGKTPEELIREFEQNGASDSTSVDYEESV